MTAMDGNEGYFKPECQLMYEGGPSHEELTQSCGKNPGHHDFISIDDFNMDHLPAECQREDYLQAIKTICDLTVKATVCFTSQQRPATYPGTQVRYPYSNTTVGRCGTGFVNNVTWPVVTGKPCPCFLCKSSEQPKMEYFKAMISTAAHVVYDDSEAEKTTFECFYDSSDRSGVRKLYGIKVSTQNSGSHRCHTDFCMVHAVSHDIELMKMLRAIDRRQLHDSISRFNQSDNGVIVSHPHGGPKKITMGKMIYSCVPIGFEYRTGFPIELKNGGKFRIPFHISKSSHLALLQSFVEKSDRLSTECREEDSYATYVFPAGTTFTLPSIAKYTCKYNYPFLYGQEMRFKFYPGTKFTSPDGKDLVLPLDAEFYTKKLHRLWHYMAYEIATCQGSSGAALLHWDMWYLKNHSGAMEDGSNRSGLGTIFALAGFRD